jgi:hypothetical protein
VKVTVRGKPIEGEPEVLAAAAGALFADNVVSLGSNDVGPVDVELRIAVAEGGAPKRVVCGAPAVRESGAWRHCATPDVKAVFDVRSGLLDAFVKRPASVMPEAGAADASTSDAR